MNPCHRRCVLERGSDFLEIHLNSKEGRRREETQWENPRWLLSSSLRHSGKSQSWEGKGSNFQARGRQLQKPSHEFRGVRAIRAGHQSVCVCGQGGRFYSFSTMQIMQEKKNPAEGRSRL